MPYLPAGLRYDPQEGPGEVQTPLLGPPADDLRIGDKVWFRHAKAGELCERFAELHLIEGDRVVDTVPTYRGEGARPLRRAPVPSGPASGCDSELPAPPLVALSPIGRIALVMVSMSESGGPSGARVEGVAHDDQRLGSDRWTGRRATARSRRAPCLVFDPPAHLVAGPSGDSSLTRSRATLWTCMPPWIRLPTRFFLVGAVGGRGDVVLGESFSAEVMSGLALAMRLVTRCRL